MHHNPDPSPKPVAGDESGIIKLSIFIGLWAEKRNVQKIVTR